MHLNIQDNLASEVAVSVRVDGAELPLTLEKEATKAGSAGATSWVYLVDTSKIGEGEHAVEVEARDQAGNRFASSSQLTVDVRKIRIDISERRLYHYEKGKGITTYPVAVGLPQYPTPRGTYKIVVKEKDPTWNPPPSPWAKGFEPVPPGPGNPLGTRWIGLSAYAIGIHGTYVRSSIGTAASHGCIRMYIEDVEELFERVQVGMPVEIVR